ncbi:MAG TPA: hypothetical protein VLW50_23300 [Streptosporangiaceae bacterium]|nr:hypothetical protein [Streptosporangiaceae bacterium]
MCRATPISHGIDGSGPAGLRTRAPGPAGGGQERLGRKVLGQAGIAAAGQQVAVDVRQRIVVQPQQPERRVRPHPRVRHTLIVVRAADQGNRFVHAHARAGHVMAAGENGQGSSPTAYL